MKASLQGKLDKLADRFEELAGLLSDPDVIGNQNQFRDLSREYAEIDPVVKCYQAYLQAADNRICAKWARKKPVMPRRAWRSLPKNCRN